MKNFVARFLAKSAARFLALALLALALAPSFALAQGFSLPDGTAINGHVTITPAPGKVAPTGVGCTIAAGSSDTAGKCTTSATSGSITFAGAYSTAPFCLIVDSDAVSATSMPVWTVSTTAITLTTVISAHKLFWFCPAQAGG